MYVRKSMDSAVAQPAAAPVLPAWVQLDSLAVDCTSIGFSGTREVYALDDGENSVILEESVSGPINVQYIKAGEQPPPLSRPLAPGDREKLRDALVANSDRQFQGFLELFFAPDAPPVTDAPRGGVFDVRTSRGCDILI